MALCPAFDILNERTDAQRWSRIPPEEECVGDPCKFVMPNLAIPAHFAANLLGKIPRPLQSPGMEDHRMVPYAQLDGTTAYHMQKMVPKKGTTTLGFVFKDGIILAVDSRASMGGYISSQTVMKVLRISDIILGTMAGGAADCAYWERHLSNRARLFELNNQQEIPIGAAASLLANIFFYWRGYGLCCGTMIAGWNSTKNEPELYYVDDRAIKLRGNVFSIGSGSTYAYGVLDTKYKWDLSLEEAVALGRECIYHAGHRDGGSGGVVRVFHLYRGGWKCMIQGDDISEIHYETMQKKGMEGSKM